MPDTPIAEFLQAIDALDVEACASLFSTDGRMLVADGTRADGIEDVRRMLEGFLAALRFTTHRITAQWHEDDVWIAEVDATYELRDRMTIGPLARAFVLRDSPNGIVDLRVYGSHERSLAALDRQQQGILVDGRWLPSL